MSSVEILEKWMSGKNKIEPPAEKPYWWILPQYYTAGKELNGYDQFQKFVGTGKQLTIIY